MNRSSDDDRLTRLYRDRHADQDPEYRRRVWEVLCARVFERYIGPDDTVLDLGAGRGEFINAIRCGEKIAVDLNPDLEQHVGETRVILTESTNLSAVASGSVDVVFSSNLLEHLPSKDAVLQTLGECHRILRAPGRLIVLMPNIRYLPGRYWDYFDHVTPLTHHSLAEGVRLAGFDVERMIPRFVPYEVAGTLIPKSVTLLRIYLRLRFLWPVFGKQMMVVARKDASAEATRTAP